MGPSPSPFPLPHHIPTTWVTKVTSPEIVGVLAAEAQPESILED